MIEPKLSAPKKQALEAGCFSESAVGALGFVLLGIVVESS
jgi:hypothetical protein